MGKELPLLMKKVTDMREHSGLTKSAEYVSDKAKLMLVLYVRSVLAGRWLQNIWRMETWRL